MPPARLLLGIGMGGCMREALPGLLHSAALQESPGIRCGAQDLRAAAAAAVATPYTFQHSSDDIVPTGDERRATNSGRSNPSAALCSGSVFLAPPVEICISGPPLLTPLLHAPPRLRARWLPCQMGRVFWSATSKTVSFSAFFIFPQLTPPAAVCRFQTCFCHVPRWQAMTALEFRWPELACFTFSPICKAI